MPGQTYKPCYSLALRLHPMLQYFLKYFLRRSTGGDVQPKVSDNTPEESPKFARARSERSVAAFLSALCSHHPLTVFCFLCQSRSWSSMVAARHLCLLATFHRSSFNKLGSLRISSRRFRFYGNRATWSSGNERSREKMSGGACRLRCSLLHSTYASEWLAHKACRASCINPPLGPSTFFRAQRARQKEG